MGVRCVVNLLFLFLCPFFTIQFVSKPVGATYFYHKLYHRPEDVASTREYGIPRTFWGTSSTRGVKHPMKFGDTTTQPNQLSVSSVHKVVNSYYWCLGFMLSVLMCVKNASWLGPIESLRKYTRLLSDWTSIFFIEMARVLYVYNVS